MALLKVGSKGDAVASLQTSLNQALGLSLKADGVFGKGTEAAVKQFQGKVGLVVDGMAGNKTIYALQNTSVAHVDHLTEQDMMDAALSLGVDLAAVKAVNQVESRGNGFEKDGTLKTLFERHKMYSRLAANRGSAYADQMAAKYPALVNKVAGGYTGGSAEEGRLKQAITIDETSAYESASYGLFQIMGFNATAIGYVSAKAMWEDFYTGEGAQLEGFVAFIKADKNLWAALKNKDWKEFARRYNGPNYAVNKYDTKLDTAYKSFL